MQTEDNNISKPDKKESGDKLAVIVKPRELKYLDYKYDNLGPDEVKVRVIGCGLDHNDAPYWEGRESIQYPLPGGVPGREGWGIIEKAGEFSSFKNGDVVAILANNALSNLVICKNDQVHKIPDNFKNMIFPASSIGYAVQIFSKAEVKQDQIIAILGNGFISSLLTFLTASAGATVLKVANFGNDKNAHYNFIWQKSSQFTETVNTLTEYEGCDSVIECTGTEPSCNFATSVLKEGGKLLLARVTKENKIRINMEDPCGVDILWAHDQSGAEIKEGIDKAVKMIQDGTLKLENFISGSYPFQKLAEAFEDLCKDAGEYNKYWIEF